MSRLRWVLVGESDVHQERSELVPAQNATMDLTQAQLVVAITPGRAGSLSFAGLDLHYSHGWRNGTQRVGGDAWLRARDHSGM